MEQQLMKTYYKSCFPADLVFRWLRINGNREISFGLCSKGYLRFLTFDTVEEFREKLLSVVPERIDVGAIYRDRPTRYNNARAVGKELVFDIDLTDYSRDCCVEKSVCRRCFTLIKVAVKLLDYSLREEFGFEKIGFVFSGRRGIHCWVTDDMALGLSEIERGEIVRYYNSVMDRKDYPSEYCRILREHCSFVGDGEVGEEELFGRMYLRLDKDVTQRIKHLIKMPFSIHPDTGVVSVPVDPDTIDATELDDFPRLGDILEHPDRLVPYMEVMKAWM